MKKLLLCAALGAAIAISGCGTAGSPTSPNAVLDSTPPATPSGLVAAPDGNGYTELAWTPNSEADVAGYEVYMYSPSPGRDNAYLLVGEVTNGHSWQTPGMDETGTYYFRVRAVDASGNRSGFTPSLGVLLNTAAGNNDEPGTGDTPVLR